MTFFSKTIKANILLIVLAIICLKCYSQHNYIKSVKFSFGEDLEKNPMRYVKINLINESDSCVTCNLETITTHRKRRGVDTTKIDTVYKINRSDFDSIVDMYLNIDKYAITSRMIDTYYFLFHTNSVSLGIESHCGLINSIMLYNINEKTMKNQIEPFLTICRKILLLAKLKPKDYF